MPKRLNTLVDNALMGEGKVTRWIVRLLFQEALSEEGFRFSCQRANLRLCDPTALAG